MDYTFNKSIVFGPTLRSGQSFFDSLVKSCSCSFVDVYVSELGRAI